MELKDFISETIRHLVDGVVIAQTYGSTKGAKVNASSLRYAGNVTGSLMDENGHIPQIIEFDVALTTSEGGQSKGGAGIFVGAVGIGAQAHSDFERASISRIKFSIPVLLPSIE